jgi:hypothetical protein
VGNEAAGNTAAGSSVPPAAAAPATPDAVPGTVSAAAQVAPVIVALTRVGDTDRLTVQLAPAELGRVQVHVERHKDGPTLVTLTADRPQTLDLLVRDQNALHRALDQAGIPADARSVAFHLGGDATPTAGAASANASPTPANAPTPAAGSGGAPSADAGAGSGGFTPRNGSDGGQRRPSPARPDRDDYTEARTRWLRAGIDITA